MARVHGLLVLLGLVGQSLSLPALTKTHSSRNALQSDDEGATKGSVTFEANDLTKEVMNIILQLRGNAKANKDWISADLIRDELKKLNIEVRDGSDGSSWEVKN